MTKKKELEDLQQVRTELARERTEYARERNQLAAERTFSAWVRTGLAGVGGGLALIKFIHFKTYSKMIMGHLTGGILLIWGLLVILFALRSYYSNLSRLKVEKGKELTNVGITSIALLLILLTILLFLLIET